MNRDQYELNVLAAVGKLLISELKSLDELSNAIFDAPAPQFGRRS